LTGAFPAGVPPPWLTFGEVQGGFSAFVPLQFFQPPETFRRGLQPEIPNYFGRSLLGFPAGTAMRHETGSKRPERLTAGLARPFVLTCRMVRTNFSLGRRGRKSRSTPSAVTGSCNRRQPHRRSVPLRHRDERLNTRRPFRQHRPNLPGLI